MAPTPQRRQFGGLMAASMLGGGLVARLDRAGAAALPQPRRDWQGVRDDSVLCYLEARLGQHRYADIGGFHLDGDDADLPVPRRLVTLARESKLQLHAHSGGAVASRLFDQWPECARILWAHSGFDRPDVVRSLLRRQPRRRVDLAFRGDHASGGTVDPAWRKAFNEFPDRFVLGTDTFTPERWHYIGEHARSSCAWLADLPPALAERIAWRSATPLAAVGRRHARAAPRHELPARLLRKRPGLSSSNSATSASSRCPACATWPPPRPTCTTASSPRWTPC